MHARVVRTSRGNFVIDSYDGRRAKRGRIWGKLYLWQRSRSSRAQIPNPMSRLLRPPSTTRTTPEGLPAAPASWQPRRSAPPGRDHSQTPAIRLDRLPVPMDVRSPGLGAFPALWNIGSNPVLHSGLGSRHGLPPSICACEAQMTLSLPSIEATATINGPVANGAAGGSWRGGPTPHTRLRTSRLTEGLAVACSLAAQKSAGAGFDPRRIPQLVRRGHHGQDPQTSFRWTAVAESPTNATDSQPVPQLLPRS